MAESAMSFADDQWRAAYLFTSLVTDQGCGAPTQRINDPGAALVELTRFSPTGAFAGCSTRQSVIASASRDVQERVEEYLHETQDFFGYVLHRVWAKLKLGFALELVAARRECVEHRYPEAYNLKINALMQGLCPLSAEDEILGRSRTVDHVLLLEPGADLVPEGASEAPLVRVAAATRDYFATPQNRETPVVLEDVLVLPRIGFGNPGYACVAVRLRPLRDGDELKVPLVADQILNHAAKCDVKGQFAKALRSLPISGDSYWQMFQTMKSFRRYSREYLAQRADAENLIRRAVEAVDEFDERLPTSIIDGGAYQEFAAFPAVRSPSEWWSWRRLEAIFQDRRQNAEKMLRRSLQQAMDRIRSLNDFIHDAALADASNSSLRLARNVGYLTWIVLLISIASLIVGALPDARKEAYFRAVFGPSGH